MLKRDPLLRFLVFAAGLYLAWYLLYEILIHPWGFIDRMVIDSLMVISGGLLQGLGYELIPEPAFELNRYIGVQGGSQLWIGDPCNGVSLFAVFIIFLLAYPGPWKHKLWFGAVGLLSIHLINAVRIASLCIITTIDYELLNFNHDFTFYVIVYSWVFGLWLAWIKWFGPRAAPTPTP